MDAESLSCLLIGVHGARLLVPCGAVVEVLPCVAPQPPAAGAPPWLLGTVLCQGRSVPLIGVERLLGLADAPADAARARIVVLASDARQLALLAAGVPQLIAVERRWLAADDAEPPPPGVLRRVRLPETTALIPDLAALAAELERLASAGG